MNFSVHFREYPWLFNTHFVLNGLAKVGFICSGHICFKHYPHQKIFFLKLFWILIKWGNLKKSKLQRCLRGDLGVGTNIGINDRLPDGIWQFQKLFWNHERKGTTDNSAGVIGHVFNQFSVSYMVIRIIIAVMICFICTLWMWLWRRQGLFTRSNKVNLITCWKYKTTSATYNEYYRWPHIRHSF